MTGNIQCFYTSYHIHNMPAIPSISSKNKIWPINNTHSWNLVCKIFQSEEIDSSKQQWTVCFIISCPFPPSPWTLAKERSWNDYVLDQCDWLGLGSKIGWKRRAATWRCRQFSLSQLAVKLLQTQETDRLHTILATLEPLARWGVPWCVLHKGDLSTLHGTWLT